MTASASRWQLYRDDVILVVEDDDVDARRVELMLVESFGSTISMVRARSRAEALERLCEGTITCIVLDLGLPDGEGLDVVRELVRWAPHAAIVVHMDDDDAEAGLASVRAGAQDYLHKSRSSHDSLGRSVLFGLVRKRSERSLAEAQQVAHLGSWELDLDSLAMTWSTELYRLLDHDTDQVPDLVSLLARVHPDDRGAVEAALLAHGTTLTQFALDHRLLLPDGTTRWMRAHGFIQRSGVERPSMVRGTLQDITDWRLAEEALDHQALHDPLTGLPNRALAIHSLTQSLARLSRTPSTVGVLFLGVDQFELIKDSLGHAAGNEILQAVAARLTVLLRPGDTLARFGADKFVVLCEGLLGELEAVGVVDTFREAMIQPLPSSQGELIVSISAGIALSRSALMAAESLLRDAEAAMNAARAKGPDRAEVFAQGLRSRAIGRLDTEMALRRSLIDGDFRVHYQPIVRLDDERLTGTEALVRWDHPTKGLVSPDQFIPIAEETGLIVPLGAWVLGEACRWAKRFQDRNDRCSSLTMSVNLSRCQIGHPGIVEQVGLALDESGLRPGALQLEITESALVSDAIDAIAILGALKGLGVRLSIDDFGTGYSSLSTLKKFPVDVLKIDRAFVDGLGRDPMDAAIVAAIIALAGAMRFDPIAEGVETAVQRRMLLDLGCSFGQGYLFSRPLPAADIEALLDQLNQGLLVPPSAY